MYQDQRDGMGKGLLLGFVVGGIAGAITALLLAPKPGKELREDIKKKSSELKDNAKRMVSRAKELTKSAVRKGEEIYDNSGEIISEAMEQSSKFSGAVKAGYDAFKEERDRA